MDRAEELQSATENALWNVELDANSASGKLDFLFEEAENELRGKPPRHESICIVGGRLK
jgi:hypothetical protein